MRPDFLCIGAIKSATTWLYANLKNQPGVWVPPIKELHYFNDLDSNTNNLLNIIKKKRLHRYKKSQFKRFLKYHLTPEKAIWYYRYYINFQNDAWYQSLFTQAEDNVCGEFTPGYAIMKLPAIQRIAQINPDMKIIYCLRNPVARAISHYRMRMVLKNGQPPSTYAERNFYQHGNYVDNYKRWLSVFPEKQVLLIYFDELVADPKSFLKKALDFLDTNDEMIIDQPAFNVKRSSFKYAIDDSIKREHAQTFLPLIEGQHAFFNNEFTNKWLAETKEILASK